jgi:hypothetical protein
LLPKPMVIGMRRGGKGARVSWSTSVLYAVLSNQVVDHGGQNRDLRLRATPRHMCQRSREDFAVSLLRLPKADRQHLWRGCLFSRKDIEASGAFRTYSRNSDRGFTVNFHFCPDCGSTVFWEPERRPDVIAVAVGSFADPNFPAPSQSVYDERRHAWVPCSS